MHLNSPIARPLMSMDHSQKRPNIFRILQYLISKTKSRILYLGFSAVHLLSMQGNRETAGHSRNRLNLILKEKNYVVVGHEKVNETMNDNDDRNETDIDVSSLHARGS